jgi:hypothetical protein
MVFGPKFRPMLFIVFVILQYVFVFCIPEDLKYSYLFSVKLTVFSALAYLFSDKLTVCSALLYLLCFLFVHCITLFSVFLYSLCQVDFFLLLLLGTGLLFSVLSSVQ